MICINDTLKGRSGEHLGAPRVAQLGHCNGWTSGHAGVCGEALFDSAMLFYENGLKDSEREYIRHLLPRRRRPDHWHISASWVMIRWVRCLLNRTNQISQRVTNLHVQVAQSMLG